MTNPAEQNLFRHDHFPFYPGKFQEVSEIFHRIVKRDEENHEVRNAPGVSPSKTGDRRNAKVSFEHAAASGQSNAAYIKNRASLKPEKEPIKKAIPRPKGKPAPENRKKRQVFDYFMAAGGLLIFLLIIIITISFLIGPHPSSQTTIPQIQTTIPLTPLNTAIPSIVITPSEPVATPGPATLTNPSHTFLTPASTVMPEKLELQTGPA